MDTTLLAQLGPYGGIVAVAIALTTKWFAHKKTAQRLKRIAEIVAGGGTAEERLAQISMRFTCWSEDDKS
jgi:hypothetical protein